MRTGAGHDTIPLVGRADDEQRLRSALLSLAAGNGGCVIIEGPAGIGKSRMLAEVADQAVELGLVMARGRATELDHVAPLSTLLNALSGSDQPVLSRSDLTNLRRHEDGRFWLVDQLTGLIENYSQQHALVVCLDDVQWADELSALTLRILVPALRSSPVLWLLACRPLPARSSTRHVFDWLIAEGAGRLPLGPLPEQAVAELCVEILGAQPGESLLALVRGSGGNPFLLETLLTSLRDGDRIRIVDGVAVPVGNELPVGFLTAVDQRLGDLPDGVRRLLEAASVLGRPFTLHEVAGVLDEPAVRLLDPAKEAVDAGMLLDGPTAFTFRHDLIREAIYGRLSGPARQALHRVAAGVLQTEGRPAGEIAQHLIRGALPDDPRTLAVVREAVAQVAPTAPGTAADLILGVLGTFTGRDPERVGLVAGAVRLLASAGRLAQARELGEVYLRRGLAAPTEAAILLGLAEALKHAGQDRAAIEYADRALALPDVPTGERAHLLAIQAHALLQIDDIVAADRSARLAAELGGPVGEHSAVVFALEARCVAAYARGALTTAAEYAEAAVRLADEVGGEARQRHPALWRGMVLAAMDQLDEAAAAYAADKVATDELGTAWSRPLWHHLHADLCLAAGRLDDAEAVAEAGLRVAEQLGASAVVPSLLATLGQIALHRDDLPRALDYLRRAQHHVHSGIGVIAEELAWEQALYADATGRPEGVLDALARLYDALPERLYLIVHNPFAGPHLVRMALNAGDPERAAAAVRATRAAAELNPGSASLAGASRHAEGLLHGNLDALRDAVVALADSPRPYGRASATEDAGVAEYAAGNSSAAISLLKSALNEYAAAGAKRDATRIRHRLRALGVRTARAQGERRPRTGWGSLTESELRVARLVADGHTNRQIADRLFLSPHTVDSHIRHAFAKLGVSSRVDLTRLVLTNDQPGREP
ncbi:AAA family ATPase [Plantactinospora sp. B5E13]|uniref:helix-turn-helix transcriptional regulator n=1 Tax=unclassified Plantactinospora TaxID=2631981 RepID=UPI00325CD602